MSNLNLKWEDIGAFQKPWLEHDKGLRVLLHNLNQGDAWKTEIFTRGKDSKFLLRTMLLGNTRLYLMRLGDMKDRWSLPGYEDIQAKLNALENVQDSDMMWFPESIRNGNLIDEPFVPGRYAIRFTDEKGNMARLNFDQGGDLPHQATFYSASAGAEGKRLYCYYTM